MTNFSPRQLINWLIFVLLGTVVLTLTACQSSAPATPTPLAAATSQPSHTPTPMIEVIETPALSNVETAVPTSTPSPTATQTHTPVPTETPTATSTQFFKVSPPILSSQGQLAFIKNQMLFVETAVNTEAFSEISHNIASASWSPQGDKMLLETCDLSERTYCVEPIWLLYDWETNALTNLSETIPSLPPGYLGLPVWLRSGEKVLFWESIEGKISILDLQAKAYATPIHLFTPIQLWELPNENLLIQDHWGTWANDLHAFALDGTKIWSFPNTSSWGIEGGNAGVLGFSVAGKLLVILEPDEKTNEFAAFYRFDPITFATEHLFSIQMAVASPAISVSPNGQFVELAIPGENAQADYTDKYLMIVDQNGRSYGQRPNSVIVDWRPDGGPVVKETVAEGQTQLLYWPLDGSPVQSFAELRSVEFEAGKWRADGRFFIYSTVDEASNQSHLYLWQPEASEPTLLTTAEGSDGFQNFAWLPDSTAVYFNFGRTELWKFEVANITLSLIASADPSD